MLAYGIPLLQCQRFLAGSLLWPAWRLFDAFVCKSLAKLQNAGERDKIPRYHSLSLL
jgi:hypothetical protein